MRRPATPKADRRDWLCGGRTEEVALPGDCPRVDVLSEPLMNQVDFDRETCRLLGHRVEVWNERSDALRAQSAG